MGGDRGPGFIGVLIILQPGFRVFQVEGRWSPRCWRPLMFALYGPF